MIDAIKTYFSEIFTKHKIVLQKNTEDVNEVINGSYKINRSVITRSLTINGEAIFGKEVLVQEKIIINGRLLATDVEFNADLIVNGESSIANSKTNKSVFFRGALKAINSSFITMNLLGSKFDFNNCQIQTVVVEELPGKIIQKIFLGNKTLVMGDILFQKGRGEVHIDENSIVTGKVIGGNLIRKSS